MHGGIPSPLGADPPGTRQTPPRTRQTPPRTRQTPPGPGRPSPRDQAEPPWDQADTPLPGTRQTTPPGSRLQHTVYERPVRILLECIHYYCCLRSTQRQENDRQGVLMCDAIILCLTPSRRSSEVTFDSLRALLSLNDDHPVETNALSNFVPILPQKMSLVCQPAIQIKRQKQLYFG